ncbi:MAG: hypothetical protein V4620_10730 [Bacteroidota bacterium]
MKTKLIILLFGGLTLGSLTKGCSKIKSNSTNDTPKQEQQDKSKQ